RWSETGGMSDLSGVGPDNFPRAINDNDVVGGTAGPDAANWLRAFRFDARVDSEFEYLVPGPGNAINDAGAITGYGYFPSGSPLYRATLEGVERLPGPTAPRYVLDFAVGEGIDDDGNIVGWALRVSDGQQIGVRYPNQRNKTELLADLIPADS